MGFGTVSLSSSLPKCVAFRLLLRFHGLSELLYLSCSFLVSAPLTYCSKNTESIYKNRLAVDLPEFKGKHRKFRNLVSSYLGKCSFQKNSSVMKFSFSSSFPHFFKNLIKKIYIEFRFHLAFMFSVPKSTVHFACYLFIYFYGTQTASIWNSCTLFSNAFVSWTYRFQQHFILYTSMCQLPNFFFFFFLFTWRYRRTCVCRLLFFITLFVF